MLDFLLWASPHKRLEYLMEGAPLWQLDSYDNPGFLLTVSDFVGAL
jgi:hypothetical protein